jgi:hypothetical protein
MTVVLTIPEGWTKAEWKAKLSFLTDEPQWGDEPVTDEEDAEGEVW